MTEETKASVVLLDFWMSPFGQRVRIALAEKGVEYEYKEEDLFNKGPLLIASNPIYKKTPVLIHDGKPICESLVISQYIDEVWSGKAPLLPADRYAHVQARFLADYIDKKVYQCGTWLWKLKGEAQKEARKDLLEILKQLEGALGDKTYFGGDLFGYIDIVMVPFTPWFHTYEKFGSFSTEEECPKLMAWWKRCMERESVAKSLYSSDEFVLFLKNKFGIE